MFDRIHGRLGRPGIAPSDLLVAALAGIAGLTGSFALAGRTPAFVAGPIAGLLARAMPGEIVTFAILVLGDLGEALNFLVAIVIAVALLAGIALSGVAAGRRTRIPLLGTVAAAASSWAAAAAITGAPAVAVGAGLGVGVVVALSELVPERSGGDRSVSPGRRRVLGALAGAVGIGIVGAVSRRWNAAPSGDDAAAGVPGVPGGTDEDTDGIEALLREADEKSLDVSGIEPLVSEQFYQVDINATDPDLDAGDWSLAITGAVENERTLDFDAVTSMPSEHRFVTLRCVGETLNGHKTDNALWTGTPIAPLIEEAVPRGGCECVMLRAADGYFEEFPLAALRRGFLAYGMNGGSLPRAHGHPVRALIPGHWGEINVKWLTEIEFLEQEADGYWEKRGWHGTGPVNTVAKLHVVDRTGDGRVQVGGHAYAGTRGIERVEVSVDGGRSWARATLSDPLPGEDVWRQWEHEYRSPGNPHEVVVRAVDGEGTVQPRERASAFPSGPTGWVSRTVEM